MHTLVLCQDKKQQTHRLRNAWVEVMLQAMARGVDRIGTTVVRR
jgi:hypothetical protein